MSQSSTIERGDCYANDWQAAKNLQFVIRAGLYWQAHAGAEYNEA
jgi:hypothetical protein